MIHMPIVLAMVGGWVGGRACMCACMCVSLCVLGYVAIYRRRGRVVRAWETLIMLTLRHAEGRDFVPRPGQYGRMSFSSDQITGTVFPHLNMPFLPNSKFIYNIVLVGKRKLQSICDFPL